MRCRRFLSLALLPAALAAPARGAEPATAQGGYENREVEGWTVVVNTTFLKDEPELAGRTLTWLGMQLRQVVRNVPEAAVAKLRTVRIWVEDREPHHPCMAYHPDAGWLRGHGMSPEKARCVEIANARNFLKWTREQPWMVLHELAHAYHDQFLDDGFKNAGVVAAYRRAVDEKRYERVLHYDGKEVRAYATTDPMEYFAEASEAYFGTNDFFPFVRAELRRHDPEFEALLKTLWGVP